MKLTNPIRGGPRRKPGRLAPLLLILLGLALLLGRGWYHAEAVAWQRQAVLPEEEDSEFFRFLRRLFQDERCVAYLYLPDLGRGYPVMQAEDNDYYLYRNPEGKWSINGSIFLDASSRPDFSDTAGVIYGHHMIDGSMFGRLDKAGPGYLGDRKGGKMRKFRIYTRTSALSYSCFANTIIHGVDEKVFQVDGGETVPEFFQTLKNRSQLFHDEAIGVSGFSEREQARKEREEELYGSILSGQMAEKPSDDALASITEASAREARELALREIPEPLLAKRVVTLTTCHRHVDRFGVSGVLMKETDISEKVKGN